jgi:hypothetical protein
MQYSSPERLYTTKEFDRWWDADGRAAALRANLDPDGAKPFAWEVWRKGREQLREETASQRLQPIRG